MTLSLVRSFGVVSLQGPPTSGLRRFGVPVGGAFDLESWRFANALAGRSVELPAWELSMAQATFRADSAGTVGVAGATAAIKFRGESLDVNSGFAIDEGEEFLVEAPSKGTRVYVAHNPVKRASDWRIRFEEPPASITDRHVLRVVAGPQAALFDPGALDGSFTVSRTGNRVGIRLEESVGPHSIELPSEPSCVGTIQVSNDGTPILLGPDGPTIGGYPKIAVVASCNIGRIGQLAPGDSVRFEFCSIGEARQALHEAKERIDRRIKLLNLTLSS